MEGDQALVLCVCHGNIGRSPIMERMLRRAIEAQGIGGRVIVRSAGIMGTGGEREPMHAGPSGHRVRNPLARYPAWERIAPLLHERDIDLDAHTFRPITAVEVACADVIYAADRAVLWERSNALMRQFPHAAGRMMLFTSLIGRADDILDFGDNGTIAECAGSVGYIEACVIGGMVMLRTHLGLPV